MILIVAEKHDTTDNKQNVESDKPQHQLQKYTCPMHPHILRDAPGKCPLCGMKLEPIANYSSNSTNNKHTHHTGMIANFRKRFYLVLILTIPIVLVIRNDSTMVEY